MDAINYIIIVTGFASVFVCFFMEALITADGPIVEKNMFLWNTYTKNHRRYSLSCAIAVAIGFVMMVVPAISFLFENSIVFGMSAIVMLLVGAPFGAFRTYHVLMNLSTSEN